MSETNNLEKSLLAYLDKLVDYEKVCELMYFKLYPFWVNNFEKVYEIKKRIKKGKNVKDKMLRLLKEGKKLFPVHANDLKELRKGNISEDLRTKFTKYGYLLSDGVESEQIRENEWNIVGNEITYIVKDEKVFKKVNEENVLEEVTDIVGLRIVCYFKRDKKTIHEKLIKDLKDKGVIRILDKELHYPNYWPLSDDEKYFLDEQHFKPSPEDSMYSALHYIVRLTNDKNKIPIEIQVRTMFEEVFGELEHDIVYKYYPTETSEKFKPVGGMLRELDHQVQIIITDIDEEKRKIEAKLKEHYPQVYEETMEKIIKLMVAHQISLPQMLKAIEELFQDFDPILYQILYLDRDLLPRSLCIKDIKGNLDERSRLRKQELIIEFFKKLDSLIKQRREKCERIIEGFSAISNPNITNTCLKECRKNIEVILNYNLLPMMNNFLFRLFRKRFFREDNGLLEHENVVNLLVEIWDRIGNEAKKRWKENIKDYMKNSTSKNRKVIIDYILTTFESCQGRIFDRSFPSFVSGIRKLYNDIKEKSGDIY